LLLAKDRDIALAGINIHKDIAMAQAGVLGEALKSARIDIVGGETMFFQNIVNQISNARGFDRLINESEHATDIKNALIGNGNGNGNGDGHLLERIKAFATKYNVSTNDLKNLTISGVLLKMQANSSDADLPSIMDLGKLAQNLGLSNKKLNV
jgi:flotillin